MYWPFREDGSPTLSNDVTARGDVPLARDTAAGRTYFGSAAVCDMAGRVIASFGNPHRIIFLRSMSKIARATALIEEGLLPGDPGPVLALAAGSHIGSEVHLEALEKMATDLRVDIGDLRTSIRRRLGSSGSPLPSISDVKSRLQNECSGEHIAALALARKFGDATYLDKDGPVQTAFRRILERYVPDVRHGDGRDHCGMPAVRASLASVAVGFARLASGSGGRGSVLTEAIIRNANLYGGSGQYSTALVDATRGEVIAKGGLGGSYGLWWPGLGVGAAVRVLGGEHAAAAAVLPLLAERACVPYPQVPPPYFFDDGSSSELHAVTSYT